MPGLTRNVGSGYSMMMWQSNLIAFIDEIKDSGQQPITQYQAVTPLGSSYPAEIALPRVRSEGTITITLRELWNQPSWWALGQAASSTSSPALGSVGSPAAGPFIDTYNIIEVYNVLAQLNKPITCTTVILVPNAAGSASPDPTSPTGKNPSYRGWTYHNVVLTQIDDSESVSIGAITMPRTMTAVYTYKTYFSGTGTAPAGGTANNPGQSAFTF